MDALVEIGVAAREAGISLTWDSEEYRYRALTWNLFESVYGEGELADWDGAGMVLQAYHRDAESFGAEVAAFARARDAPFQVRLVKGAYWDAENEHAARVCTESPVFQLKHETDCSYERLTCALLQTAPDVRLALAGHNIRSHAHGEALREHLALAAGSIEHQTLFGMAPAISRAIPAVGWPARDYVPIGDVLLAMAYYSRRLVENASQVGFLMHLQDGTSIKELLQPPCHHPRDE
jgi:RHH-type transcriptional regulator, proline utilization regulon repressor / proline dehydrogenase / delta 1-pyrroline-5-carboxylate dehydrogenase